MNIKLYEIASDYQKAFDDMVEMDLPEDVVSDSLAALKGELVEKGRAVGAYVLNLQAQVDIYKAHEAKIAAKRKTAENSLNWLKNYLKFNMEKAGITKIEGKDGLFSVKLTKPRESVVIDDLNKIPEDYIRTTIAPDKTLIKKAIKDGFNVIGAHLGEGNSGIKIG